MILEIMGTNYLRGVVSSCNPSENTPPSATLGCNNSHTTTGGVSTDTHNRSKQKGGFTLVELSIVLIIIGLIVGGVLGGQSLIKSAELQRVVNEFHQYKTAINAFRLEYNALPGDMNNATDYWSDCKDDGKNTCNGNRDGIIGLTMKSGDLPKDSNGRVDQTAIAQEGIRAWQHMSLAGIVPGNYTGLVNNKIAFVIGETVPKSATGKLGYGIGSLGVWEIYNYESGISISLMGVTEYLSTQQFQGAFSPKDTKAIDTKMDDGRPDRGLLFALDSFSGATRLSCTENGYTKSSGYDPAKEEKYKISSSERACRISLIAIQ